MSTPQSSPSRVGKAPRIGVLGCGYWGKNLVRNFHDLGVLQRVCDPSAAGREKARSIAPGVDVQEDFAAMAQSDIDGVVVATPAVTHYELCRDLLRAGKDVFVEKPMALRVEHAVELVELAQRHERILMVGHVLEYHPGVSLIRDFLAEGRLGKIHYVYSNRLNLGKFAAKRIFFGVLRLMISRSFCVSSAPCRWRWCPAVALTCNPIFPTSL
ncbi:MAG: Gfo/Idh/MocA family oxidoreductase [Myxococcota bacterium]